MSRVLRKFSGWSVALLLGAGMCLWGPETVAGAEGETILGGQSLPQIPRGIAQWEAEGLGNHRAVVQVDEVRDVVWTRIAWRRIDPLPELKGVVVVNAKTGALVGNVACVRSEPEFGDVLFEAKEVGQYYVYYMPYREVKRDWNPFPEYFSTRPASASWGQKCEEISQLLSEGKTPEGVGRAAVVLLEDRGQENAFGEMEIPATDGERDAFLAKAEGVNLLFFQEPISNPIRMTKKMPVLWTQKGASSQCKVKGARGETVVFQLGLVAPQKDLIGLQMGCVGLKNSQGELKSELTARGFNFGGTDFQGAPLLKELFLKQGEVLPLWLELSIPETCEPGIYTGELLFSGWNLRHTPLPLELEVLEGGSKEASLQRLHWLNSTAGVGEKLPGNFPAIQREGNTLSINHHTVELTEGGLLAQVEQEFLALPMDFRVKVGGEWLEWKYLPMELNPGVEGGFEWSALCHSQGIVLNTTAEAEEDGFVALRLELTSRRDRDIEEAELVFVFEEKAVPYFMGLGVRGGERPEFVEWEWSKNANQFFWIGDVDKGLYCKLLDRGEKQDVYFMPEPYQDWYGDVEGGGISLKTQEGRVYLTVRTGAMKLVADEEREFRLNLMLTPFGKRSQSVAAQKVYAGGVDSFLEGAQKFEAVEQVVLGYDAKWNPYLNAPFLSEGSIQECIKRVHEAGKKVHFALGSREIPYQVEEFWPLWSLDSEVFTYSPALKGVQEKFGAGYALEPHPFIGTPWLCEHLCEGYSASWLTHAPDGKEIVTLGVNPLSRWQNYYLEAVRTLAKDWKIDGIRTDWVDRRVTKRLRRVLDEVRPGLFLDAVTGNNLRPENGMANPMAQYLEHASMWDSIVFADGFSYEAGPDYYLVELSGIPFGVNTSFQGAHPWRSLLYGGLPQMLKPDAGLKNLWEFADRFGMRESTLSGYWDKDFPLESEYANLYVSLYRNKGKALVVYHNWGESVCEMVVRAQDFEKLGFKPEQVAMSLPQIDGFQNGRKTESLLTLSIAPGEGALVLVEPKN